MSLDDDLPAPDERIVKCAAVLEELRIPAKKVDVTVETCGLLWVSDSPAPST